MRNAKKTAFMPGRNKCTVPRRRRFGEDDLSDGHRAVPELEGGLMRRRTVKGGALVPER